MMAALGVVLAAFVLSTSSVSAMRMQEYQAALVAAGYTVDIDSVAKSHAGLSVMGETMHIDKGGKYAAVEFLDYKGDRAALSKDWIAADDSRPRPRVPTNDFAGKILYWNDDSVLAVDFGVGNFREIASAAGEIFLGRRGTGGPLVAPVGAGVTTLPATGNGTADGVAATLGDLLLPLVLVVAGGVALIVCGGEIARRRRR